MDARLTLISSISFDVPLFWLAICCCCCFSCPCRPAAASAARTLKLSSHYHCIFIVLALWQQHDNKMQMLLILNNCCCKKPILKMANSKAHSSSSCSKNNNKKTFFFKDKTSKWQNACCMLHLFTSCHHFLSFSFFYSNFQLPSLGIIFLLLCCIGNFKKKKFRKFSTYACDL